MEDNQSNPFTMPMISRQLPDGSTAVSFAVPDRRGKTAYVSSPTIVNRPASATKGTNPIQKAIDDEQQNFNSLVSQAKIPEEKMRPTPDSLNASRQRLADLQWAQNADFTDFRIDTDPAPGTALEPSTRREAYGIRAALAPEDRAGSREAESAANDPKMPMESRNQPAIRFARSTCCLAPRNRAAPLTSSECLFFQSMTQDPLAISPTTSCAKGMCAAPRRLRRRLPSNGGATTCSKRPAAATASSGQ